MQPHTIILLEGTLSLAFPLSLALYELVSLKREPPPRPPGRPSHGQAPLPPSLTTVTPAPRRRQRVLEDA